MVSVLWTLLLQGKHAIQFTGLCIFSAFYYFFLLRLYSTSAEGL